ncbi:MAG: hypothetical protein K5897_01020 [Eubacterium sp.]|nr:hypothetical protein [Eubacterium sp.]
MVRLFDTDIKEQGRRSSKGNQLKFERDDMWYKADYLGYEGLAEYVISELLHFSNLNPCEYVGYEPEQIEYNGNVYPGCRSRDFTEGWDLITLERLFKDTYGYGLNNVIYTTPDHKDRLKNLVNLVERTTGLSGFGIYMTKMLTVDALFLNEDRHTHNIAVMTNDKREFRLAPLFDQGAGLLSDTKMDYPMGKNPIQLVGKAKPKTFCDSFTEQLDIAEELYGCPLKFTFEYKDVKKTVDQAVFYEETVRQRVIDIVMEMRRQYSYLF